MLSWDQANMMKDGHLRCTKIDLATGACTPQPSLLSHPGQACLSRLVQLLACRMGALSVRGPISRTVGASVQMQLEPSEQESSSQPAWQWRALPGNGRSGSRGCVLSDGRFDVFGGVDAGYTRTLPCEALTLDAGNTRWDVLSPLHDA